MVDIVVNHMAWNGTAADVQYNTITPFNASSYYHPYCDLSQNATTCWQTGYDTVPSLPDLKTEDANVRETFGTWITELVSNYSSACSTWTL